MQLKIMVIWDVPPSINPEYFGRLYRSDRIGYSHDSDPEMTMGMMLHIMPSTEERYCRIWEIENSYKTVIMAILLQLFNLRVSVGLLICALRAEIISLAI